MHHLHIALNASNGADFHLYISPNSKDILIPIPKCLCPNMVEQKFVIIGESKDFRNFNASQIAWSIPTKEG